MTQIEKELQELKKPLATYMERLDTARAEIESLRKENDRLGSHLENERSRVEASFDKIRDVTSGLQMQGAVHATGFDDFKKRWEESDRRRWTIYGVMLAAILTFAANLILLFMRK